MIGEYFQYDLNYEHVPHWVNQALKDGDLYYFEGYLFVKTLEGDFQVNFGDYIVRGSFGELYLFDSFYFGKNFEIST